jgi:hypothetical protein
MSGLDSVSILFLPFLSFTITLGIALVLLRARGRKAKNVTATRPAEPGEWPAEPAGFAPRPQCWLTIKHRKPPAVKAALGRR